MARNYPATRKQASEQNIFGFKESNNSVQFFATGNIWNTLNKIKSDKVKSTRKHGAGQR
jgi:hypothetical protein